MALAEHDPAAHFAAVHPMRSDAVVHSAISTLLRLARQPPGPLQARAAQALNEEFGPYAVSNGCAPSTVIDACDGIVVRAWLWDELPPTPYSHEERIPVHTVQPGPPILGEPFLHGPTLMFVFSEGARSVAFSRGGSEVLAPFRAREFSACRWWRFRQPH